MKFNKLPMNIQYFSDPNNGEGGDGNEPKEGKSLDELTKIVEGLASKFNGVQEKIDAFNKKEPNNEPKEPKEPKQPKDKNQPIDGQTVSIEEFNKLKNQLEDINSQNTQKELDAYAKAKAKEEGLTLDKNDLNLIKGDSKETIDAKIKSFADYRERLAKKYGDPNTPPNYGGQTKKPSSLKLHSGDGQLRSLEKYQTSR